MSFGNASFITITFNSQHKIVYLAFNAYHVQRNLFCNLSINDVYAHSADRLFNVGLLYFLILIILIR